MPKEKKEDPEMGEIQGKRKYNPKTGKYEYTKEVSGTMDTVAWKEPARDVTPPITSDNTGTNNTGTVEDEKEPDSELLNRYKVAIMLPFMSNKYQDLSSSINSKSKLAINLYGGMKMAFDELSHKGIQLNVSVLDTEGSPVVTKELLNRSEVLNADMIIGPVRKDNLKLVADFAKKNKKPLVSPISPSGSITKDNPYYIQIAPPLEVHCKAITKHARARYDTDQVVLVVRKKSAETKRLKLFQNANAEIEGRATMAAKFKEFVISDNSADLNETDFMPYFASGKKTVFIVPSWSSETFIYSLLRKIRASKGSRQVVVYGMPQWLKYTRISYDYYDALNLHVSSAVAINPESSEVKSFNTNFYYKYGDVPTDHAFIGFDIMTYFGKMLDKHGTQFQQKIDQEFETNKHTKFEFEPTPGSTSNLEKLSEIGHYQNGHVNILEFKDFYFQRSE